MQRTLNLFILSKTKVQLTSRDKLLVKQSFEGMELLGFETRNKFVIMDENKNPIGHAAEQGKGILGFFLRQYLGHWRKFDIHFFDENHQLVMIAHHPFRFFFQRLEINSASGNYLGALQQRFAIFSKKFDVVDERENVLYEMRSPIWKIWTFPFYKRGQEVARVEKKWTGLLAEMFTDKDTFLVHYKDQSLSISQRLIILATSLFIDLQYFEKKAD